MNAEKIISKYFMGQLSPEEQARFDVLLETDSEFREQFEFESKVRKSIFQNEHERKKSYLKSIEQNLSSRGKNMKWFMVAASIVVLVALSFLWRLSYNSPESLFNRYYEVASNTSHPILRSNDDNLEIATKAFIAYEGGDYSQAQKLFQKAYAFSNTSELLFYEAISQLENDQNQLAIKTFQRHLEFRDDLKDKTKWYLAMAYLKIDKKEPAKQLLKEIIANSENYNFDKANEVLSKL